MIKKTAVLLIGFGGPESADEIRPFLDSVLKGIPIPKERYEEVVHHYEAVGGSSPYNAITFRQREALEKYLDKKGVSLLVAVGLRHSRPSFVDAFKVFKRYGIERVIGFVLSNFRSYASFEKYIERVDESLEKTGATSIEMVYTPNFHDHPNFIRAQSEKISEVIQKIPKADLNKTYFIFSSHSIPIAMAEKSFYDKQYKKAAELIAKEAGLSHWSLGYQSRSGRPQDPWLVPDVKEVLQKIDRNQFKNVVFIPVGFLCDNVEVIYDLDTEARKEAESFGFSYLRASTVTDHPVFIEMVGESICALL